MGFIENLHAFNRKERYWLLAQALADGDHFRLAAGFRKELRDLVGFDIPQNAFAAMDYHLDWLYASLTSDVYMPSTAAPISEHLSATQEDIDLVVAFSDGDRYRLILIEAKGEGSWTNKQFRSKADRLKALFESADLRWQVDPHFVLCSPRASKNIDTCGLPEWIAPAGAQPRHLALHMPGGLARVERCTDQGLRSAKGGHWHIVRS